MAKLKSIILKIGFPDREKVGKDGTDAVYTILMHTFNDGSNDDQDMDDIVPLIKAAVNKGTFPPYYLATLIDRHCGIKHLPQIYGTYWERDKKSGNRMITSIENISQVDKRRKEIGLPPLSSSAKHTKLILPDSYIGQYGH